MAIIGIETVVYGVNDVAECTRYFVDFGLPLMEQSDTFAHFRLEEGSNVQIRHIGDSSLPKSSILGTGVVETIWGVDTRQSLDKLAKELGKDREVRFDEDGTVHSHDDDGIAFGLRLYRKNPVVSAPSPSNSPGNVNRVNTHRKWKVKACPKTIQHVVYQVPDYDRSWAFYRDRLGFKLTDVQKTFGIFGRGDGARDHHNIYFLNSNLPFPGFDGKVHFDHVNYGVEDIDELMVGANYMQRRGWPKSDWGLGRHRIASSLFMYLPCPTGGQAEYGADSDMLDDTWVPRIWEATFGSAVFVHNLPFWLQDAPAWDVAYAPEYVPPPKVAAPVKGQAEAAQAASGKDADTAAAAS